MLTGTSFAGTTEINRAKGKSPEGLAFSNVQAIVTATEGASAMLTDYETEGP